MATPTQTANQLAPSMLELHPGCAEILPTPTANQGGSNKSFGPNAKRRPSLGQMARHDLWPTPNVPNGGRTLHHVEWNGNTAINPETGAKVQVGLEAAVKMWPTPNAQNHKGAQDAEVRSEAGHQVNLQDAVTTWPTPTARDHHGSGQNAKPRDTLDMAVERGVTKTRTYPTPDLGAAKGRGMASSEERSRLGGSLNPTWVEWLQGYPIGWTDLEHSETQ